MSQGTPPSPTCSPSDSTPTHKSLPTMGVSQRPYLSWKPPQGADSSGSRGVRGQNSGGGIWLSCSCPEGLCGGTVLFQLKSVAMESPNFMLGVPCH